MLGPVQREDILKHSPEWQTVLASYNPKPEPIEKLRALTREVTVEVYFGSWCPDSRNRVSEYFKILDVADCPLIQTRYVGIPEDKAKRPHYFQGRSVDRLPTFIVFVDGKEKGRIVETPRKSVEEDLLDILVK